MIGMTLTVRHALECRVCHQNMDSEQAASDTITAALVGAVRYAFCPGCGQEVQQPWDAAYKRRWTRRMNRSKPGGSEKA